LRTPPLLFSLPVFSYFLSKIGIEPYLEQLGVIIGDLFLGGNDIGDVEYPFVGIFRS